MNIVFYWWMLFIKSVPLLVTDHNINNVVLPSFPPTLKIIWSLLWISFDQDDYCEYHDDYNQWLFLLIVFDIMLIITIPTPVNHLIIVVNIMMTIINECSSQPCKSSDHNDCCEYHDNHNQSYMNMITVQWQRWWT